jgi:hypothetical protein
MIRLASAIKELDQKLLREARGYSLESAYQEVPDILKGYVELVYDLNNQPSVRFIEGKLASKTKLVFRSNPSEDLIERLR